MLTYKTLNLGQLQAQVGLRRKHCPSGTSLDMATQAFSVIAAALIDILARGPEENG